MKKITLILLMMFVSFASFSQWPEGFEGTSLPNAGTGIWVLPTGNWQVINENITNASGVVVSSAQAWGTINSPNTCGGTRSAYINKENVLDGTLAKDWLVTPQVTVPNNGQLRFFARQTTAVNNLSSYSIRVSTTSQTDISTFTTIQTWTETEMNAVYNICEEKIVDFPTAYIGQPVYVAFVMTGDDGDRWIIDDVNIVEKCLNPSGLSATPTATTSTLNWIGNGSNYEIEHLVGAGATPTGVATGTSSTNSFNQTGLTANTQYCYYVRSTCTSGTTSYMSEWTGPFCYFTTLAPVGCGGNFTDPGGATAQYANNANVSTLICPDNNTDLVTVTFTAFNLENNWDFLRVYAGTSAAAPLIATYTGTAIPAAVTSASPGGCLFFAFTSDGSGTRDGWIANIACAPAPTCSKPITVTTTNVLPTSVTVNWVQPANPAGGSATQWEVLRLPCGSALPNATTTGWVSAPTNPFTVTGLTPDTCYTFYVRSVCSPTSSSVWSTGVNATTPVIPPACGGTFTDPGGATGNYANNANVSTLICPTNGTDLVTVTFTAFNVENNWDFLKVYAGTSAAAPLIATYTGTAIPTAVTSASPGGCLFFVFTSDASVTSTGWIASVTCAPAATCSKPVSLVASNVLSTSATLTWTQPANPAGGTATQWQYLALPCGSPLPNATTTGWANTTTPSPFTVTGLNPDTCYTFYVRAVCSTTDSSTASTGVNGTTQQVPPACGGTFTDAGGANGNYANNSNITTTICPDVSGNVVTVSFSSFLIENNFDFLKIYDGSTTAAPLLGTYTGTNMPPLTTASLINGGCLTFLFTSDSSVASQGWVANIICGLPPSCPKPIALTVVSSTSTSATLGWTEAGTSTNWNIVVQPIGTGYPSATSTIIPTLGANPFTIGNLNSSTQYEFYVQSDCGAGDLSFWSGPRTFSTLPAGCGANAAAGDACVTATPICNLNGYCGNTSSTYTDSSWPELDTAFCGSLENNSFLTYIATATSISFQVNVSNCANNDGIQMMIFSAATCGSGPVTSLTCWNPGSVPTGPATVSATGLVVGQTYYLMIDGWANDVCDYTISVPGGGTQTNVDITPATATVCLGSSINLVASGGNGTFVWTPSTGLNTATGATVTYTPTAAGTYVIRVDSTDPSTTCTSFDTTTITVINEIVPTFNPIGSLCIGDTFVLPPASIEGVAGSWSPPINNTATTTYTFTPNANQCATTATMEVIISSSLTPTFAAIPTLCTLDTPPTLETSSDNGIVGTWNPTAINNTVIGTSTYIFTPNASCATPFNLSVTIEGSVMPTFTQIPNICKDLLAPSLPSVSNNGINGTWSPLTIDTSVAGTVTYTFTPDSGQCGLNTTMDITIDAPSIVPAFTQIANICKDFPAPTLETTSSNSIVGTWNPSTIDTSVVGTVTYTFTPDAAQCGVPTTMNITIDAPSITVSFTQIANICKDLTAPALPSTSIEGVAGTWNPSTIDTSVVGMVTYAFTPAGGQCAVGSTMDITIDAPSIVPTFTQIPSICKDLSAPALPPTSNNGMTGIWSPLTIDTSIVGTVTYTFTPDAAQCGLPTTMDITIDAPSITVSFTQIPSICQGLAAPALPPASNGGVTGTWNPSMIDTSTIGTFTYTFTPNGGQCAIGGTMNITIDAPSIVPTFTLVSSVCKNSTAPVLPTTSNNSITGVWSPSIVNTSTSGTVIYTFTPNAGQCAVIPPTVSIEVIAAPSVDTTTVLDEDVCKGSLYTFPNITSGTYYSGSEGTGTMYAAGNQITINATQTFYVYAAGSIPSCWSQRSFTVTAVEVPVVTLSGGCLNNVYTIEATVTGGQAVNYTWYNSSDAVIQGQTGSTLTVSQDGMYSCVVTLASGTACTSSKSIFAANGTVCTIQKGISPNNDGKNDNFDLTGLNVKKLDIFNRYGKIVYTFSNYTNQWYGQTNSGNELPSGTYFFVIERDNVSPESGWIYINR